MSIEEILDLIVTHPEKVEFGEVISSIDTHFDFTPTAFRNGDVYNDAGQNTSSCKIFSFGLFQKLDKEAMLTCFGSYYKEVLETPEGDDHQNIRNFMKTGWEGLEMDGQPLKKKRVSSN